MAAIKTISPGEYALIAVLTRIVMETMPYPPTRPYSADSHLPANLIADAQSVLADYGCRIEPNPKMMADGAAS